MLRIVRVKMMHRMRQVQSDNQYSDPANNSQCPHSCSFSADTQTSPVYARLISFLGFLSLFLLLLTLGAKPACAVPQELCRCVDRQPRPVRRHAGLPPQSQERRLEELASLSPLSGEPGWIAC